MTDNTHLATQVYPGSLFAMDLVAGVRKEGSRGGRGEFKWEDVRDSQHRENYLGHSLMARTSPSSLQLLTLATNIPQPWAVGKRTEI